jgi:dolichol-phosphate mannosyltransferase
MQKVSIVIPVFNEEESLRPLYEKLKSLEGFIWEAILVNDGSRDKSGQILKELAAQDERIRVINFVKNYGQTPAMSAGFSEARYPVVVPMDADLQNDPSDIPQLLAKMDEGYDVVSGWRKNRQDKSLSRVLPSRIANRLISSITGVHLHDYGCTLKAYKLKIIQEMKLYGEMHRFIPAYAAWHGARVTEIVVKHHPRQFGQAKYGIGRTFKVVLDLLVVKFLMSYSTKPMHFFGFAGFWSLLAAFIFGVWAVYLKLADLRTFSATPLPLMTAIFFVIGIQFILMGLLAEMLMRNYYENGGRKIYRIKNKINFNL